VGNAIARLDNLLPTLTEFYCYSNGIATLDNLPPTLEILLCNYNPLIYDFQPTLENIRKYNLKN